MVKAIIFDADGMAIHNGEWLWFSKRFSKKYGVSEDLILPFFKNEFQQCLVGKADLKEELKKYISEWGWKGSMDELLEFWFTGEDNPDKQVLSVARELKVKGLICSLATNNEKYRTNYMIERMGFGKIFDKVYSSAFIGFKKPEVEFYQYIIDDLQLLKNAVLFWDDEAEKLEEVRREGFMIEKYTDFENFKEKLILFGLL